MSPRGRGHLLLSIYPQEQHLQVLQPSVPILDCQFPVTTGKRCAEHRPRAKVGRLDNIVTRGFPTLSPELQLRW